MTDGRMHPDVAAMLHAHGIMAPETPITHNGYSGARISAIEQGGQPYLLKRMRWADDWIMRATRDRECREAQFAVWAANGALPDKIGVPSLDAARDGDGFAVLMRDISPFRLSDAGPLPPGECDAILSGLAALHATPYVPDAGVSMCSVDDRVRMLSPASGARMETEGINFGVRRGWSEFDRRAPPRVRDTIHALFEDPRWLCAAVASLPQRLLHGDVKAANLGLGDGRLWLFDWSLVTAGPVGLDMGWFIGVNSALLPWPPGEILDRYRASLTLARHPSAVDDGAWSRETSVAVLSGMALLGWAKALDASEGRTEEFEWWCQMAPQAASVLGLH